MAESLGRTVGELLYGSPAHRPITSAELTEWFALWKIRQHEREQERKRASRSR